MRNIDLTKPIPADKQQSGPLHRVWFGVRLVFVISTLAAIGSNLNWPELWRRLFEIHPLLVLLSFSLILLLQFVVVSRWYVLLRTLDSAIPLPPLLAFHLVGIFYSQFLPSSISGDLAKGYYLSRAQASRVKLISSALVDRLIGLVSNGMLGLLALTQAPEVLDRFGLSSRFVVIIFVGVLGAILVGYGVLFFMQQWVQRFPQFLRSINDVLFCQARHPTVVMLAVLMSGIHFLGWAFCIWLLAVAVQITNLSYIIVLLLLAAVNVAQFVPLSINGWGIREGTLIVMLGLYGVSAERAILLSLLIVFSSFVLAVLGGYLVLIDYRYQEQAITEIETHIEPSNSD